MKYHRVNAVRGFGASSWLISREGMSQGGYSHIAPMLPDGSYIDARNDAIVAPSNGWSVKGYPNYIAPGVQHRPPQYELWKKQTIVEVPWTDEQEAIGLAFLKANIGAQYDQRAIESFVFGVALHGDGQFICSAFELAMCRACGLLPNTPTPEWEVPPDTVFMMLTAIPGSHCIYLA